MLLLLVLTGCVYSDGTNSNVYLEDGFTLNVLIVNKEKYYYISAQDSTIEKQKHLGFFRNMSSRYDVFSLDEQLYPNMVLLQCKDIFSYTYYLYVNENNKKIDIKYFNNIPVADGDIFADFPCVKVDDCYYYKFAVADSGFKVGNEVFFEFNKHFYQIPNKSQWFASESDEYDGRYDLYFRNDLLEYVPIEYLIYRNTN